jgi:serine/threonine-protein kinase
MLTDAAPARESPRPQDNGDARFAPGQPFAGRFRIVSLLGRGAMGEVYRADDLRLGQPVALKLLTDLGLGRHEALTRFTREVRLARTIGHPNVCRVFDIGEADGWHYLSMEYVDGETLVSIRDRIGRLVPEKAYDVARQLCAGLAAAHDYGVLHRDLKPANIMLDGRGRVRIMDFGLAMQTGDRVDRIAGTPAYMAPEQLAGSEPTERSDLFSLGLVIYEIVSGLRASRTTSPAERSSAAFDPGALSFPAGLDQRVVDAIRRCLAADPAERPQSALHVAAALPGGDAITAALAAGRVPTPDIVASTRAGGALSPAVAASALGLVIAGLAVIGWRGDLLTVAPADVPKPPEVLADRARELLRRIGDASPAADEEFGFEHVDAGHGRKVLRFVFRRSPELLTPFNLLHLVTRSDPPNDLPGMATVTLAPSGALLGFSRIVTTPGQSTLPTTWEDVFQEASLDIDAFAVDRADLRPLVPHDDVMAWAGRRPDAAPIRVTGATLAQLPVAFDVGANSGDGRDPGVLSTGRPRLSEGVLWVIVMVTFGGTAVMVRRHLRAGEGDLHGAGTLATAVVVGGVVSMLLHAHHVPHVFQELLLLLSVTGWGLVWGGFSWLAYLAFEPHVRRLWPRTLITWTRVLSRRFRDPLVGRDVLLGMLAGTMMAIAALLVIMMNERGPTDAALTPAVQSLRSLRLLVSRVVFLVLDGMQFALGGLFLLVLLRVGLRRTWLAVVVLLLINVPLSAWQWTPIAVVYSLATAALFAAVVLRLGLLAGVAMLATDRLLTSLPFTFDFDAWYVTSSSLVLVCVLSLAILAFRMTGLSGRAGVPIAAAGQAVFPPTARF